MIPNKIKNTPELSNMLIGLRKKNPQNNKILTKEEVSLAMGKGRTWLSQVETGRLKKISSDDFIKFFEIIMNSDYDKARKVASLCYETEIEQNDQFTQLLQQFCSVANDKFLSLKTQSDQKELVNFLENLYFNFTQNYTDFKYLLDGLDLSLLNTTNKWDKKIILEKIGDLKNEINLLSKKNILKELSTYEILTSGSIYSPKEGGQADGMMSYQEGLHLLYRLSDSYKKNPNTFQNDDLNSINSFFEAAEKYSNFYYSFLNPLRLSKLTTTSINELDNRIFIMKSQLQLMIQFS